MKATFQLQIVMHVKLPKGEAEKSYANALELFYRALSVSTKIKVTYSQSMNAEKLHMSSVQVNVLSENQFFSYVFNKFY